MRGVSSYVAVNLLSRTCRGAGNACLNIARQQPVEKVHVCSPKMHQILELLNWGGLHSQQSEACKGVSTHVSRVAGGVTHIAGPAPHSSQRWEGAVHRYPGTCGPLAGLQSHSLRRCKSRLAIGAVGGRPTACGAHVVLSCLVMSGRLDDLEIDICAIEAIQRCGG